MMCGAILTALIFSVANALVLAHRISVEEGAMTPYTSSLPARCRGLCRA